MGIANDLKRTAMLGRFAPKPLATFALFVILLQCLYNKQAIAKPRPKQYLAKEQWTGNVQEGDDRHWSDLSIKRSINERDKRSTVDKDDTLEGQKGFKVLTASSDKREGIETPIEALKSEVTSVENTHEQNSRSNVNEPNGGSDGSTNAVRKTFLNNSQQKSATTSSQNKGNPSGSESNKDSNIVGEKRAEVTLKSEESKLKSSNLVNNVNSKQDSGASSADSNKSTDKAKSDNKESTNSPKSQDSPSSVTVQGNTVNGQPNSEPVKDPVGNSGSEVVTSHPVYEDEGENSRFPYRDARSKPEGSKGSSEPEVGHFQVDDKSADLEINANSAGVKVKAKPASLQVVSRPGAHPPTPIVPVAPFHPYFHHHHHYYPYLGGFRRSRRPYHRRLYDSPYHAHYRAWIPPPGHLSRPYFDDSDDVPFYRRGFNPYRYGYHHHRHHHRHHSYPMPELYDRSDVQDMYNYPIYRRRFRGPYRRRMYGRRRFGYYGMPESRFHIPRRPREFLRHDIVTPMPPPLNVYGNPPPGILNGEAASMFGMNGVNAFNGMPGMGEYGMGGLGMNGPAMNGPLMPGMNRPGFNGLGMNPPGMFGMMTMNEQLGNQEQFNGISRSLEPRNAYSEPKFHVKKTAIQGIHKKNHVKAKITQKRKAKLAAKKRTKILKQSKFTKSTVVHARNSTTKSKHRLRRSAETEPKRKIVKKLRAEKVKEQKGNRKNSIVIHRPPIIYHPPPEIYHRPDIVVHRAPIMLHRPSIIYHQPPVVVHRPAIIYHQPSIVFHQPPPVVHQPIMHSHDTYVTRPVVLHSSSSVSHAMNYLGIPNHVYSDYEGFHGGFHGDYHGSFQGDAFRKHNVPGNVKTVRAEIQGKIFKKSETSHKNKHIRPKRDIYTRYLDNLDYLSQYWKPKAKRHVEDDFDIISSKKASSEALTYKDVEPLSLNKRNKIPHYYSFLDKLHDSKTLRKKRAIDDDLGDDDNLSFIRRKKKKDVVVNRPPIIYHPPPEVYHRPDIVVHRPPLVIHRPPIIYHQPPVIVHRPAVVYHQPPIVFHQPPPAVSQPLLFSHDSFTIHPSFYATHHGSVVRDYGHYIGIPNIVSNYGAPLFHSGMGKRSNISKPAKKKSAIKSLSGKPTKKSKLHHKKASTENPNKKNSVVIRRPPIIYHPPPEIYHRPDIVVHRAPIMIHRAPIVYHQPPVVVHRPAIVYHQPSLVFHQPPPAVHQPLITSHDTWVTHSVPVPLSSRVTHHSAYVGIPKHAYMNLHGQWGGNDYGHAYFKSEVPKNVKGAQRDNISKTKKRTVKKSLKHKHVKEEKAKRKNSVMIKRPPIIYHPPPEIFHRPDIVVHRPPILVHRAPIVYHQPPVIVHRPAIVYHQPNVVFHQPMPMVHQPIMQSHDTWVTRPAVKLYGSTMHRLGAITQYPHAYYHGHNHLHYMAYGKSKVPSKEEKPATRDEIKHDKASEHHDGDVENSGDDDEDDDDEMIESGSGSAYGDLDIEVVPEEDIKSKLHKTKPRTESASKKDKISKISTKKQQETTVKGSKKNSVVIHRPPIIYHPPPEIYHRPDIVVHRAPIVLYRAPIIYHQPPVVVHRPAIVYHQPSIVFHQPPPMVHQPIMHSHDNYVAHSVAVPVGSHITHVMNYHGVPHEEIYMEGIGHGAFAKSVLPLNKGHKRDKIKSDDTDKGKDSEKANKRSRRSLEEDYLSFEAVENHMDANQPIGAEKRIRRAVEQSWISNLGEDVNIVIKRSESDLGLGLGNGDKRKSKSGVKKHKLKKRSATNVTDTSSKHSKNHSKKTVIIIRRPPILFHPPSHVIHRPNIMVHRPPIIVHRHPLVIHRPPILVHRMPIIIHRPPVLIHRMPLIVRRPDLMFHRPPILIHRMPYVIHPHPWLIHRPPIVIHKGPHMMIHHSSYIHHYPSHIIHMNQCHGCGCHGGWCGKSKVPKIHTNKLRSSRHIQKGESPKRLSDKFASDHMVNNQGISSSSGKYKFSSGPDFDPSGLSSYGFKVSENLLTESEGFYPRSYTNRPKRSVADSSSMHAKELNKRNKKSVKKRKSNKKKKKDVVVSRPPIIYHPPPEVYHRPEIVVHRAPILIHRPPIVYHQPPVVVHRPAVVYHQPPIVFHQPPPSVNQPLLFSHDQFILHPTSVAQHVNSVVNEAGHYIGIPHGGIDNYPGPLLAHPFGQMIPPFAAYHVKRGKVQRPNDKESKSDISADDEDQNQDEVSGESSGDDEIPSRRVTAHKSKPSKGERKNNVLVYRPPMIYHPPPEIYDRPNIVVHRPDLVIHRPSVVYHQPSVVIHRPPIVYQQPPVVFHQPPPLNHQPIIKSHDSYVAHQYLEPHSSFIQHTGSYVGAPHYYPGSNAYGWGVQGFNGPFASSPGFGLQFGSAFGRSMVEKASKKDFKDNKKKKTHGQKASTRSKHKKIRHKRSNKHPHHHHHQWHHKDLKRHAYHGSDPVYTLMEQHESFITDPLSQSYLGENSAEVGEPAYTKSRVAIKGKSKRSIKENGKRKEMKKQKKGNKKNIIIAHRPPMIYHPPPEIYDRPDIVVHRPDIVIHRPSVVYHQPSVVLHRPPVIYHEPPVVFHQPSPMVHHPIIHSHDTYVSHPFYEPYASHIEHAGSYVGAPHFFGGGFGYGYGGFGPGVGPAIGPGYGPGPGSGFGPGFGPGYGPGFGPGYGPGFGPGFGPRYGSSFGYAFGKSKIEKGNKSKKESKKRTRRSTDTQKKASKTGNKKNMVLIQRPPMIYHPPPEIYDRPDVVVHRPDLVIHRPSIVYHQPSVVIHRPPVIYQQPPVVFHQPPPLNTQPVLHAHDSYIAHTYHEPIASSVYHAGTYVGAPHYYPGGWGIAPHSWGPAFGKSKVPKANNKVTKVKRATSTENISKKEHSGTKKSSGDKKNIVVAHRPPMIYHPPPEIYHRPDIVVHRPDIVIHRPSVVYHQPSVVVHRPPVIYRQPPVVFHQPSPMVHHPIIHSHDTYVGHPFYEPYASHVEHAGSYVGAPHLFGGGFGYGYGGFAGLGPAFGKSKVTKSPKKTSTVKEESKKQRSRRDVEDKSKKIEKKTNTSKSSKGAAPGHKKNLVVMRRPPVIYHPPPEVYHRPDVILHRPDIVIHRPSVVFHQSAVVIHRPPVIYHQPPIVFHQPTPMVHQPILHSHETYLPHHYYEPAGAHVTHAGTYVGAPHFYHGGWGWGYGYHAGHAFGKSKVEDTVDGKAAKKAKSSKQSNKKDKEEDDEEDDDDEDEDDDEDDNESKITKSKDKSRRSLTVHSKSHKNGHKKNIVVMRRPPVVYHPPPEVYHRPDVVLHRPDIVIHRPSVVFHQSPVVLHRPSVVYHQPPIVFHQPTPMVHQPIIHSHETYLPHHFYEPFHSHIVHGSTYVGAPHFFGGGWGWGYGHGHAFGKSKVEKTKKSHHHKTKRDTTEDKEKKHSIIQTFRKFFHKRSVKVSKKDASKKTVKGAKKNMVLIQRPPMIYHPPPEIYDRPNIVVHRPDLVYHQPSIVYHQSSVVVHRAPVIYHPPPVVFHQPPPLVHQNVLHSHDSYMAHQFFEPFASHIQHSQTYVGAPHFFGGGWGYGYGLRGPITQQVGPWNGFGPSPAMFHGPFMYNGPGFPGPGFHGPNFHGSMLPFNANGMAGAHGITPQAVGPFGPAFAKSDVERAPEGKVSKTSQKAATTTKEVKHTRKTRSLSAKNKNSNRLKSHSHHHKGLKKNVVVMQRPPIMFHPPPEVYHRPNVVIHRPDVVIHRPPIVVHQAPVVVHKPAVLYHQSPVVLHQPPPFVHQPVLYSHDAYVPHTYYEPFGSEVGHAGTYVGAPHGFDGGWGYGYGHVVGGFGKSKVEKTKSLKDKKAHQGTKKSRTIKRQENASKKVNILHAEVEKDFKAEKKNDIVVNRPPIIYHPPPEVYHRPDIVVHRAPIVVHRPPIIYHQPPVVVHRPAVVYHQPPIVFHQPPPAVHQPIIHSHDTFVLHHAAMYEPHGSTVSHQTNYIGIPSHVEHFDEGFDYHGDHGGYHDDFLGYHGGYHGNVHGGYHGYHGGFHAYRMLHRSNIEHAKNSDKQSSPASEESSSTKSTITKTETPIKKENTHTVITDEDQRSKTISKRQIIGSHSLYLPVSPLNAVHPKGPIVERLQKMSTIPGVPSTDYEHHVAKRDLDSQKEKRQLLINPGVQAPLNYANLNALTPQRVIQHVGNVAAPLVASPPAIYPRLPLFQPLVQPPFFSGYQPVKTPGVNVHVETERSTIPDKMKKRKGRQRRQVLPMAQPDVFGVVPHLLFNQAPVAPVLHGAAPQLPQQLPPQYLGYHPITFPSYPFMNVLPQRRPHVNINVQSMRSSIPTSKRKKKSVAKRRSKRQLLPQLITPLAFNYLARAYGPYNPYWNINMNPLFFRRSPETPQDDAEEDESDPDSQNLELIKQYLTNLYEFYTGETLNHKRPKVDVEVHASKSDIPGSTARNIIVRSKRQMSTYLPQSPLTTGRYDIPISGPLSSLLPLKRSKVSKPKRSLKKDADNKVKTKEIKESNSKRDEFAPQSLERKTEQSNNLIQMNPDNPDDPLLRNEPKNQFSTVNGGAEGLNEIGPGGLNGAIVEPEEQQTQTKEFFQANAPQEQNREGLQQEFLQQQQQDLPVAVSRANNGGKLPYYPQTQEMQGQNRMELPMNEEQMLRLRGQVPFFPPGPQIPLEQRPPLLPGPSRPFFYSPPVFPQRPVPLLRPFAPLPFAPIPEQEVPLPFSLQSPMASFFPEQQQQGTVNVNVNTAKSKLPRVKRKKKTEEHSSTEKQVVPVANNLKNGDKRQRISLFQRVPAMQVLPQRFLQNGVLVPSFNGNEPRKESQTHGVNGMVISELQMQRKHAIPSKVDTKNILTGTKKSDLSSKDEKIRQKTKDKSKKVKRQIYGMNELPQEIKFPKGQISVKKFKIRADKEKEKKDEKRYIEILKRALGEKASTSSKLTLRKAANAHQVGMSGKKPSHLKRQFVMPFGVERAQAVIPSMGLVAEQGAHEQVPQVIGQYQQDLEQVEQVGSPQQTHVIQEPAAAYGEPVQHVTQVEEPLNRVQSFANEFKQASEAGVGYLGHRPKVQVSVQIAKSSIGKGSPKIMSQEKKGANSKKDKTITKRQLFGTVPLFSPLGRADVNSIVKAYEGRSSVPDSQVAAKQQQGPVLSRRSLTKQMHERQRNSKKPKNAKRQLGDLISNILERRRGPKLLGDLLKKPKQNPPIMFTTGNANNNDEKPIDVFPGNPGGNQNPGEGQPRLGDGGIGNPFARLLPPPPPAPVQNNQNPLLNNPTLPGNQAMYQDDQSAIAAAQASQQPPPLPLLRQGEPDTRQNVLQFLQNAGLPNPSIQQRLNLEPQMLPAPFMPPVLPMGLPAPVVPQAPMNDAATPGEAKSRTPSVQPPPGFQLTPQVGPPIGPFGMGVPSVFPMMPFNAAPASFFPYPSLPSELEAGPGITGMPDNHLVDNRNDERPSVNVSVQTAKSKIPKKDKS